MNKDIANPVVAPVVALLAALSFGACVRELPVAVETPEELMAVTLTASLESDSKQSLDGFKVLWEEGDSIMVCFDKYSNQYVFVLNPEDVGKSTGRFTGEVSASWVNENGPLHAVYPAGVVAEREYQDYLSIKIPSTQKYREGSFGKGANICMCTTSDISQVLSFKNTGGLLKLTVKGSEKVKSIELSSDTDILAGSCHILKTADSSGDNFGNYTSSSSSLTLDCGDGVQLTDEGKDFYIFAPYGTLANGFTVKISDTGGGFMKKMAPASEQNVIQRSKILSMPALEYKRTKYIGFIAKTVPGEYDNPESGGLISNSFVAGGSQCGIDSGTAFNLRSWSGNSCTEYSVPSDAKLIDKRRGLAWYVSKDGSKGYIIAAF